MKKKTAHALNVELRRSQLNIKDINGEGIAGAKAMGRVLMSLSTTEGEMGEHIGKVSWPEFEAAVKKAAVEAAAPAPAPAGAPSACPWVRSRLLLLSTHTRRQ